MISLPNFTNKMELTQAQYDKLLELYIESIVDDMDMNSLIQFAKEQLEIELRENCSIPDDLVEEISCLYGEEYTQDLLESVKNV